MILQGVISKLGAVFIIIPEPIVGGIFCVMFGMICAFGKFPLGLDVTCRLNARTMNFCRNEENVEMNERKFFPAVLHHCSLYLHFVLLLAGLSALQYINLNSARNLYILGFSMFFPMVIISPRMELRCVEHV